MSDKNYYKTSINWFPGHMTRALRMMEKEIDVVDLIIYVLDGRAPFSCVNPSFKSIIKNKPIIYIINKIDLANDEQTKLWKNYFSQGENQVCIELNSTLSNTAKVVIENMKKLLSSKLEKNAKKGIFIPMRAMVIGVPNCGKSTLINNLCGKGKTITGDKPGVTRGKQWVKIDKSVEIMDTPGTLWPDLSNEIVSHNLAYIGAIREEVVDISSLALDFINDIKEIDANLLKQRYKIEFDDETEALEIYEKICKARGFIQRGNNYDYERCSRAIFDDFKKGRLGKITVDIYSNIFKNT